VEIDESVAAWFAENWLILLVSVFCFTSFWLVFGLCLFQLYLVITNQTTWEALKRHRISYLQDIPEELFPFNQVGINLVQAYRSTLQGILENIGQFIRMSTAPVNTKWKFRDDIVILMNEQPNHFRVLEKNPSFNYWNNQYWSCC
jgi:hypothetical protein